jgi:hypothetical protein
MDKESLYLLQKIDCNCNDCGFMNRDLTRLPEKQRPAPINYGYCVRFEKPVSFIPGVCQLETQNCFIHRKDAANILSGTNKGNV